MGRAGAGGELVDLLELQADVGEAHLQAFGFAVSALAPGLVGVGDQVAAYHDQPRLLARVRA